LLPDSDENLRQLRVYVAHELGHLFFAIQHPDKNIDDLTHQNMANIFGVFAMLERNDFYMEKATKIPHKSWGDVVDDFSKFSS